MSQNLSILSKKMAMILSVSASTGKQEFRLRGGNTGAFYGTGISIFADYRYYPNQVVYHKILEALEAYKGKS